MKHILIWLIAPLLFSCSKTSAPSQPASLTIYNGMVGSNVVATIFTNGRYDDWFGNAGQVPYGYSLEIGCTPGRQPLALYQFPDTTAQSAPFYSLAFDLPAGTIHSLFLTGTNTAPDTLLTTDNPPYHPASDSSVGIRFVNLSPGSAPVSVDIQGLPNGSEVAGLPYKGITAFKNYPATNYVFEFRSRSGGILIATYAISGASIVYRNVTIVLGGASGAQGTFLINNY